MNWNLTSMSDAASQRREFAVRRAADYLVAMLEAPMAYRGQQLRGNGPVAEFEEALARRCGFPFCIATTNATSALLVAALAARLADKEIVVAPQSWGGTYGPFEFVGSRLVRAKADANGNIAPASISALATDTTAAVVAVDWNGVRHQSEAVRRACSDAGVLYIEDSSFIPAPAINAPRSLADVQVISFGPGKPLSLGEGGALLTRDRGIYERAVAISQHPERSRKEGIREIPEHPCLNARMHHVAAIVGHALLDGETQEVSR
jgi:perosamine synthetase